MVQIIENLANNDPALINIPLDNMGKPTENQPERDPELALKINANSFRFYTAIFFSCIGGFLFGYDTGIISGAMLLMKSELNLTIFEQSTIVSVTIIGAWMFSLLSGWSSDMLGRKITIFISSIVFTVGSLLMAFAYSSSFLIIGRFVLGIAIGLSSSIISVYIAEITQYQQRGTLVTVNNALCTGGQFVAGIIAGIFSTYYEGWRWMCGLAAVPSVLQALYFAFGPESPRYLLKVGKEKEAYESLQSLRCNDILTQIEFTQIKQHLELTNGQIGEDVVTNRIGGVIEVIKQLKSNVALRKALILGCTLQLVQQLAGINTIMYYSATIIEMAGIEDKSKAIWLSSITGLVNFLFTFVGMIFVERLGRRKLILFSVFGVCLSLLFLSGSFYVARATSPPVTKDLDSNSTCSPLTSCTTCVAMPECGFCFTKDNFESTCLAVDDANQAYSKNGWCSTSFNNSLSELKSVPIFTANTCPSDYAYLIILGLVFYVCIFASGLGSMPWVINSEIFPLKYRSACFSLTVSMNWFSNTFVSLTFLSFIQLLTESGTFLIYFFFSLLGLVYFYFDLPETKGKKLEEIEKLFDPQPRTQNFSSCNEAFEMK